MIRTVAVNSALMIIIQVVFIGEAVALIDGLSYKQFKIGSAEIDLGGEYRLRGEDQNNFNIKIYAPEHDDDFILSRLRLNLNAALSSTYKTIFQFHDAHIFGSAFDDADFALSSPYHANLDIRQAYINYLLNQSPLWRLQGSAIAIHGIPVCR